MGNSRKGCRKIRRQKKEYIAGNLKMAWAEAKPQNGRTIEQWGRLPEEWFISTDGFEVPSLEVQGSQKQIKYANDIIRRAMEYCDNVISSEKDRRFAPNKNTKEVEYLVKDINDRIQDALDVKSRPAGSTTSSAQHHKLKNLCRTFRSFYKISFYSRSC